MADSQITKYQFLNQAGVQSVAEKILSKVNERIGDRIVTSVDASSNDKHVASAKVVYDLTSGLSSSVSTIEERLDGHDTDIEDIGTAIEAINTAQGVQDGRITTLEGKVSTLETTVGDATSGLVKTVADNLAEAKKYTDDSIGEMKIGEATYSTVVDYVGAKVDEVNTAAGALGDRVTALETSVDTATTGLKDRATALEGKVSTLETTVGDADSGLVKAVATNTSGVAANAAAITALQSADTVIEGRLDTAESNIGTLQTDLDALEELVGGLTHITMQVVEGGIATVAEPKSDVIYLQRDDANDGTWMMYVYQGTDDQGAAKWVNVGDTEVDLSNYWTKDDADAMREALSVHDAEALPTDNITAALDAAFASTIVDLS